MAIIQHFASQPHVRFTVLSNKPQAPVLAKARMLQIDTLTFNRSEFEEEGSVLAYLEQTHADLLVLAGFLWLVPPYLVRAFPQRIVNIHPALLPKFGGKGMYGHHVHQAVLEAGETESGMTIHYIDEQYDQGEIILQKTCPVLADDTPETLAARVLQLEHTYYPQVVASLLASLP
jgi:phosphoribosylglycinamide formyltransferase-1